MSGLPMPQPHLQVDEYDGEEIVSSCATCGETALTEDDETEVEGETLCRGCALEHLTGLAAVVLGHDYRRAAKVEAANRLDKEIVTLKGLVREMEREIGRLL